MGIGKEGDGDGHRPMMICLEGEDEQWWAQNNTRMGTATANTLHARQKRLKRQRIFLYGQ